MKRLLFILSLLFISSTGYTQTELWGMTSGGGTSGAGTIFKTDASGNNQAVKYNFLFSDGEYPVYGKLIQATNGLFYGMTEFGGVNERGVLFEYNPVSGIFLKRVEFAGSSNGAYPKGSLMQASDGMLYGMTSEGGTGGLGVIFQFNPTTNIYTKKIDFSTINGIYPYGDLVQAANGRLYGMTTEGGVNSVGVLFDFNPITSVFSKRIDFNNTNGSYPYGSLLRASDGFLYGLTVGGGDNDEGVLFQFNTTANTLIKRIDFTLPDGAYPEGTLVQATDGMLYGTTTYGGDNEQGVLFQYNPGTFVIAKKIDFSETTSGDYPYGSLVQAPNGMLYGTTQFGGTAGAGVLYQYNISTSVLTKRVGFGVVSTDGENPCGHLTLATDGMLYGMTTYGGAIFRGSIFQFNTTTNVLTRKLDFKNWPNGGFPQGSLLPHSNGKLYGMASLGAISGKGNLFEFNVATNTIINRVSFSGSIGSEPVGTLMQAADGKLYGTTYRGGANLVGTLFQYDPVTSAFSKKFDFDLIVSGGLPVSSMIQATDGMLYGLTKVGGSGDRGVLFQYNPVSSTYTKKFTFIGPTTGEYPEGSLVQAADGMLYGTTVEGGTSDMGVLFQYNPVTNVYTKKIDFTGAANGLSPNGSLLLASDGMLYGLTAGGGLNANGILFQYNTVTNTLTKKFDFNGAVSGSNPRGGLMQASDGSFYGMTNGGGTSGRGVMFQYNPAGETFTKKLDFNNTNGSSPVFTRLVERSAGPLPVKFLFFNGACSNGQVILNWATATETGNNYFNVEKSTDAVNWSVAGRVSGQRNTSTTRHYNFTDPEKNTGIVYYRLKQVDIDGRFEYAEIISFTNCKPGSTLFTIGPNPAGENITIRVHGAAGGQTVQFFTAAGALVKETVVTQTATVSIAELPDGIYFVSLKNMPRRVQKIIKQ
ncbi:MAG TPA: choice-of-anchor tandem repeat GloVer-containing protein [Ferruginibacter sp.]|nr:choice-of-anchor tandem repeat GloVer-containing protein [Ferruginibacter sp.]